MLCIRHYGECKILKDSVLKRSKTLHYSDGSKSKQTSNYLAVCFLIYTLEDIVTQNNKHHFLQIFCKKIWRYRKWFLN